MSNVSQEKRIMCVGKVHADFVSLRMASAQRPVKESDILTDAEMKAAHEDYSNDIADREYHRRGSW